jgi:hypothetical protein
LSIDRFLWRKGASSERPNEHQEAG